MRSLFVHDPHDLDSPIPGGVQLCSREFLEIVRAASDEVALLPVSVTRAPAYRLRRRFGLGSYLFYRPEEVRPALAQAVQALRPSHIFLNRSELLRLAPLARELAPEAKVVIMSHGNQSGDDLYEVAGPGGRRPGGFARLAATWQIGLDLVTESRFRHQHLDAVCVMSDEEEMLERWLGAPATVVLPRVIHPRPLDWKPVKGRVGFVGTLNHTPNRIALERLCDSLAKRDPGDLEIRIAGGPEEAGRALASRYRFIHYVGRPDDAELQREVATWSLFLNPIFWLSRGASMKLGQALAWSIPTLSTRAGARGYRIAADQVFMTDDSAAAFATVLLDLIREPARLTALHDRLVGTANWPNAAILGQELKAALT